MARRLGGEHAELAPAQDWPYVLAHGVVQHGIYHAGQIALLKKARLG